MTQTSKRFSVLGGDDLPPSNLWEDVQAMMALARPEMLPLPVDHTPAA